MKILVSLFLVACGTAGTRTFGTTPSSTPPAERASVNVRFVHMYASASGTPGPGVDIYRRWGLGKEEATPVVTNLGYGEVSPFIHPLNVERGDADFAFYTTGTHTTAKPFGGFTTSDSYDDGSRWTVHIVTETGFVAAWNDREEAPVMNDSYPPAANPAKARVVINLIGAKAYSNRGLFAGSSGVCLNDVAKTGGPSLVVTNHTVFDFNPGTFALGLYANPADGPADCSGTPVNPAAMITAAAGSRTWLYLYGTSAADLRTLVLPFGE